MDMDSDEMIRLHDEAYGHIDLHAQEHNIKWDMDYVQSSMRDLPVKKLVCVRAPMGIGKTIAIRNMLERECTKATKVLCVTFSRSLAAKLYNDFERPTKRIITTLTGEQEHTPEPLGFENYQNHKGDLNFSKIVVCLDSLHRVTTSNFHFVILDEAVSVFLHFNSKLMKNSSVNSWKLELFIRQCQRATYFVDAALDTTFMSNIVNYFKTALNCKPHWIRNKYIRPSNRKAIITTCDKPDDCSAEESLVASAIKQVQTLLQRGDKVVVCSSTKSFTELLDRIISETMKDKRVLVYNSSRSGASLEDVNSLWIHYDLLVYSPSVSAGVSFTVHHFDSLVAYLVNSRYTPSVDLSLQQLFRVRNLTKGEMHIHVHNKRPNVKLPHTVTDIEQRELSTITAVSASPVFYEAQMMIDPDTNILRFDKDRLSYHILLGIKLMHNNSAVFYTGVLCATLKDDYAIDIVRENVQLTPKDEYDRDLKILMKSMKTLNKSIPFAEIECLDDEEYESLNDADAELTEKNILEMKLYVYRRNIYGISVDNVDEAFYKTYVEAPTAYELYCRNKRFRLATVNSLTENKRIYAKKMEALMKRQDYNLDMYKKLMSTHHKLLLTTQTLIQMLLENTQCLALLSNQEVIIKESHVVDILQTYRTQLKTEKYGVAKEQDFYSLFQISDKTTPYTALKNIMKRGMGIDVRRGATNQDRPKYGDLHICSPNGDFEAKYQPTYPTDMQD
jgi:hypothetical protein